MPLNAPYGERRSFRYDPYTWKQVPSLLQKVEIAAKTKRWPGVTLLTLAKVLKVAVNDIPEPFGYDSPYGKAHPELC